VNYHYDGVSLQNRRQSNMDSLLLKCLKISRKNALLAVVCDGVGSLADGAFASGTATRMLGKWFSEAKGIDRIGLRMRDTVLEINTDIISEAKRLNMNTASTLSALLLIEDTYHIVHAGDSRVYCYSDELLSILTNDDISTEGKLTSCIGISENIILQYSEGQAADRLFLLCSDGLYKRMNTDFMIARIKTIDKRTLKEALEALTRHAIECGEQDNISLALVLTES